MVYRKTVCMFTTKEKRKMLSNQDNSDEWIYDIIPAKQIAEIKNTANRLQNNLTNGLNIVLSASHDSAIRLCRGFKEGTEGNIDAWMHVMGFISALIQTIEEHLAEEGINPYDK